MSITENISRFFNKINNYIMTNADNPLFWIIIFFIGILIFAFTYKVLNKNK